MLKSYAWNSKKPCTYFEVVEMFFKIKTRESQARFYIFYILIVEFEKWDLERENLKYKKKDEKCFDVKNTKN